jgi:hypothetical protein
MVAKIIKTEKAIKKVKALPQKYNGLNQVHFKTYNDLNALQTNLD